jgi:hypothetical protein
MEDNGRDRVGLTTGTVRTMVDMDEEGEEGKGADGVMEQPLLKNRQSELKYIIANGSSPHTQHVCPS